jgi:thiol:disulfide interchange protein
MKKYIAICILSILFLDLSFSQIENPVKWKFDYRLVDQKTVELIFTAIIEKSWHMYGAFFPEGGPIPTTFHFDTGKLFSLDGPVAEITPPIKKKDPNFDNMEVTFHNNKAIFIQKISIHKTQPFSVKGYVEYMACNDQKCLPPREIDFNLNIAPPKNTNKISVNDKPSVLETKQTGIKNQTASADTVAAGTAIKKHSQVKESTSENRSLWKLFITALLAGLGGVFTPCVYPMIPLTVMFFVRGSENRFYTLFKGFIFGLSIIIIYILVGLLLGSFIKLIAANWLSNLFFFLLFIAFALSFLGLYEIVLPGSLATNVDRQADKGGFLGVFFMALALVIVSSSCTVPIIGSVLIEGSSNLKQTIVCMLGYSLAFAFPFSFFAMFPALLKSLPHSGGWLNSFKVILGLIILMFSFKYLVIVDQSLHLNLLSREVIVSIWIVIAVFAGFYLLGKVKFIHDAEVPHITIPRFLLASCAFSFGIYLFVNLLNGGSLENFASFFPSNSEKINRTNSSGIQKPVTLCNTPKYSDFIHLPYGLQGYFDYKEGLACAGQQNKPVLLDFKGYACAECKVMEAKVWSNPEVLKLLNDNFIIIALYTDERTKLPENEWFTSKFDGKLKKTIGQLNEDIEIEMFNSNAQPLYCILNKEGKPLVHSIGAELDVQKYLAFLQEGIENFKKDQK